MKFKLIEKFDYNEFSESILSQYLYDAVDELENASLERYIEWFRKEIPEIDQPDEDLFITCVRDAYIQLIDYGEIAQPKTMITSQLKEYVESHKDIINDTDELMRQCPDHLQHELKIVLSKLDESLTEDLLTEVQSPAQRAANKKYKNDIEKIDSTIIASDYVVHHIDKTNRIKLTTGETIQVTDKSNCVLLPKIEGDSNVIHQAVHGALVCGSLDNYVRTLKQCEVITQTEDNSISRVPLEDFIKNSIR